LITPNEAKPVEEHTTCYKKSHSLRVFTNADGGYVVTCDNCDLWTTIPVGESLKGKNRRLQREFRRSGVVTLVRQGRGWAPGGTLKTATN